MGKPPRQPLDESSPVPWMALFEVWESWFAQRGELRKLRYASASQMSLVDEAFLPALPPPSVEVWMVELGLGCK